MKIIAVDDESANLDEIKSLLAEYDASACIETFTDPQQALAAAECGLVDFALLDIEMSGMTGLVLAEQLQKKCPRIMIIYITAYNNYATEAFELSAIDYLLKPIRKERLFKAMEKAASFLKTKPKEESKDEYKIFTFGKLAVLRGRQPVHWLRNKSEEVFAYLLENAGTPVHKDVLCDLAWPDFDYKRSLVNLQTTIYSIRKALNAAPGASIGIDYSNSNYTLNLDGVSVDFLEFERLLKISSEHSDRIALQKAIRYYKRGEYLAENGWTWAEVRRVDYHRKLSAVIRKYKASEAAVP